MKYEHTQVQILLVVFGFVAASRAAPSQHSQNESGSWIPLCCHFVVHSTVDVMWCVQKIVSLTDFSDAAAEEWFELDSSEEKELEQNMEDTVHDLGFSDSDVEEFMEEASVADHDMEEFFEQLESKLKDFYPKGLEAAGDILEGVLDVVEAEMDEVEEVLNEAEKVLDEEEDEVDDVEETADEAEVLSDLVSDEESHED